LEDGLILKSQAHLLAAKGAAWDARANALRDTILAGLST